MAERRQSRRRVIQAGALSAGAALGGLGSVLGYGWPAFGQASNGATGQSVPAGGSTFSFERLIGRTRELAQKPYQPPRETPDWLSTLTAEQWRKLRFRPERALWRDWSSYQLQLIPNGWIYRQPVKIHVVEGGTAREIVPSFELFETGDLQLREPLPEDGFAGLRVHYPLNHQDRLEQLLTFLGASFFRAIGRGTSYGASARGLALNTGLGRLEEFPAFREFYIVRPAQPFDPLTLYALLDSPSIAGAFRFDLTIREHTRVDVDSYLFFRTVVEQVGIAPLTSMFFFGPNDRAGIDDVRPQVHNSDGLAVWTGGGEVLWRPLVNPSELRMSVLADENPRGFGLIQRNRDFFAYQDLEARFDIRPNLWVEPRGSWGKGSVRLIEVPSAEERNDNIVAFWTPEKPMEPGRDHRFPYGLVWSLGPPIDPDLMRVRATRIGDATVPETGARRMGVRRVVIDFDRPSGTAVPPDLSARFSVANPASARLGPLTLRENPITGGHRVIFDVEPTGNNPVELRGNLASGDRVVSEIWLNRLDRS